MCDCNHKNISNASFLFIKLNSLFVCTLLFGIKYSFLIQIIGHNYINNHAFISNDLYKIISFKVTSPI